jgi:tetratricopeptide (TPR) repeat protein
LQELIDKHLAALDRAPADDRPLRELENLFRGEARWAELLRALERRARSFPDSPAAPRLLTRAGDLLRLYLDNPQRAEELYRRALASDPAEATAFEGLEILFKAKGDFAALAEVLERRAALLSGAAAAPVFLELGGALERLGRRERAILAYQRACRADPALREAFARLCDNLLALRRHRLAVDVLDTMRARFGPEGLCDRYVGIAEKLSDVPPEHAVALRAANAALEIDPKDGRAAAARDAIDSCRDTWRGRARALRVAADEERDRKRRASLFLSVALLHATFDAEGDGRRRAKEALDSALLLWPGMPQALDALESMSAKTEDWKGLDALLERMAADARERNAAVEILTRLTFLRLVREGDRAGAFAAALKAAQVDPSRAEAAGLAAEFLLDDGKASEAAALLERHLSTLGDKRAEVALHLRLAEMLSTRLNDGPGAQAHLEAALRADPANIEAARALIPYYEAAQDAARLVPVLEMAVSAAPGAAQKAALLERIAGLCGEQLDRPQDAVRALARAVVLEPANEARRAALEGWAEAADAFDELAAALRAAAARAEPEAARALLSRAAQLLDAPLERLEEAMDAWRELLALHPEDEAAKAALESLLARTGSHAELHKNLEEQLAREPTAQGRRALLEKMARGMEQAGGDPAAAANVYRRILEIDPGDRGALRRLGAACASLERYEEVAEVAGRLAALASDAAESREWRWRRAQVLADRLNRKEEAAGLYLALLAEEPNRPGLVAALERLASTGIQALRIARALHPLYLSAGDVQRAAAALQTCISGAERASERVRLWVELADLCEARLADPRAALSHREQAFRLSPSEPGLAASLERLAGELSAQAELAALFIEVADRLEDREAALSTCLRAAQLAEVAGDYDLASQALARALSAPGGSSQAPRAMHRLAVKAERWADAEKALRLRLSSEPDEAGAILPDLAWACERQGKLRDAAAALEESLQHGAKPADILPRLSRLFEQVGDLVGLQSALARELALAEELGDRDRAARLRLKLSKMLERTTGDRAKAIENYAAVLAERPSDPEALAALEKMLQVPEVREAAARALAPAYEAAKEYRRLVFALEVLQESAQTPAQKVALLKRAAQIHAVDLRQTPLAFATLARALKLTPGDAQLRVATRRAAEEADSVEAYAEILAEAASAAPGQQALPLLRELAEVSERKLGDRPQAIAYYRRMLEIDPESLDALRGLHRLHRLTESWAELALVCRTLAKVIYDDKERVLLYREAAALFESGLGRPEDAAACYRSLAETDPLDRDAALALDRLYEGLSRPQDLAFALELRRAQEGNNAAGREVAFRLAELKRTALADPPGSLALFGQILADDPTHAGSRAALEAWARSGGAGSLEAAQLIDPALAHAGEHPRRVALREARLGSASGEERAELWAQIRRIQELEMARPELAFLSASRAFLEGVDRERVLPDLERLARDTGSFEELAEVFEEVFRAVMPGDEMGLVCLRRAAQLRSQLGEGERAVALWKELLGEMPGDREALDALVRLHEKSQNAKELAEVYRQKAQVAQDAAQRGQLLLQAGHAKMQVGDDAGAVELGRAVLVLLPKNRPALELLDRALGRMERAREQADVLRLLAETLTDAPARRGVLLRRAALLEKDGEASEAVDAYARVLAENAGESAAVEGLERLFAREQGRRLAAKVLEPHYRSVDDARHLCEVLEVRAAQSEKEERRAVLLEIARMREALGQKPLAFAAVLRCFKDNIADRPLREELERLAAETGAFEPLAAAYEAVLEHEKDEALQLELWRRMGALYGERLGRPERSAHALEKVYRRAPDDAAVLETLSRIYRKTNGLRELGNVLWRQVAITPEPARKRELLVELAQLAEERLNEREAAITAWREIRKLKEDDAQAVSALARLLPEAGRFDELAELVAFRAAQAERQGQTEESLELLVQLGRIKLTRLADPRGALALFSEINQRRPGHAGAVGALEEMARCEGGLKAEAALALEPIFAQSGDYLRLVQMLEARAQTAAPAEKAALLRKVSELYAGPLDSADMAFVFAGRALDAAPDEPESLAAAVRHAGAAGAHEELAALLSGAAERARTDEGRAGLHRALAQVYSEDLQDPDQAIAAYRKLLELAPGDPGALDGLAALFRAQGHWAELLEVLRRQGAMAQEAPVRAEILRRIGEIQDEELHDDNQAIATFRRMLELAPDDERALARLEGLCTRAERWAELADTLAREAGLALGKGRTEQELALKVRLAQVREERLLDKAGALALYREILAAKPGHAEAVARLSAMIEKDGASEEAAELLADAYRTLGDHGRLAKLLDDRSAFSQDAAARKRHLMELAQIRELQGQPELALVALFRGFREDPTDAPLRRLLERIADEADGDEELAALYEEELGLNRLDGRVAGEVCLTLARLHDGKLADSSPEQAIAHYEKARAFEPELSPEVLPALDRLYKASARWGPLADVIEAQAERAEGPAEKIALLQRLGQLAVGELEPKSPDRAARAYEQVLALEPGDLPAARALEKLYEAALLHDRQFAMLSLQRETATGPEKERLTLRMAEVAARGMGDAARGIALYGEALAQNPRCEAAFSSLEALYEETGQLELLVELAQKRLSTTVDPREITRLSEKVGRVLASLQRNDEAVAAFRAALERDPRHRRALESLRDLYEQAGPSEDLAAVLRRLIPLQDDAEAVKRVRLRLAEVLAGLGRREEAVEAGRRALDVEPHKTEDLLRAEELFRGLGAHAEQVRAMEARAELLREEDPKAAAGVLFGVAEIHSATLGKREAAAPAYERVLDLTGDDRLAFDALREIYASQGDWRRYAAVCERFLPALSGVDERLEVLKDLGAVQETRLKHKDLAFLSYCRAFQAAPANEEVRAVVHRLAEETGSFEELATVYDATVDEVEKGPVAERLYLALARIYDERLDEPEQAEAALRKVLEFDPTNRAALEGLSRMFSRRGRDAEYVVSLEQKIEAAGSIEERKVILKEIAQTYQARLRKPEEAAHSYLRTLELEPDRETFRTLAELYRNEKQWREAADVLVRARDYETEAVDRAALQVEVADLYERGMGDDEAAVAGYRLALEFDPECREALSALERLYTKLDRPAELLGVYDAQLRIVDLAERVTILFKTAGIWEDRYRNLENADACLEAVLVVEPDNLQAIKLLERLRRQDAEAKRPAQARWEDLLRALEQHLATQPELSEQVGLLVQMGEVYYKELKRIDRAAQMFQSALELDPGSLDAMHALGLLYERSGNWGFALEMLDREAALLEASPDAREAVELHHRTGRINEEMLQDLGAAKEAYLRAVAIDPGYLPSLKTLKGIYQQEQAWDPYLEVMVQEANHTVDVEERAHLFLDVAHFYQDSREDAESASRYFEEALKLIPTSLEAARPLADLYVASERWDKAEKMLDIVAAQLSDSAAGDPEVAAALCRQLYRLGYVCEKLEKKERALGAYERAYQLDSRYLPAAEGYANLLGAAQRHADALPVFQAILIHHKESLTDLELVEYQFQVGESYRHLEQPERARAEYDKALRIDASHEHALGAMVEVCEQLGDYESALEHRANLAGLLEGEPKFAMQRSIGRIAKEKLNDPYRAIDAYVEALKLEPEAADVLEALLGLYRETRQSQRAAEALEKLLALPAVAGDAARAKKLLFTLGEILRDELKEVGPAADAFNRALDVDYRFVQAFAALEQMLGQEKQWEALEQNYLRMVQRLPKTEETHGARMALFKALGGFYESVKKDKKATRQVFQVVVKGSPADGPALEKYAELTAEEKGSEKEAIEAWRRAVQVMENPARGAKALARLFATTKDYDGAYVAAQVSALFFGEQGAEEREILTKLSPYARKTDQAQRGLNEELWRSLFHAKVRGPMGEIFALVYQQLGATWARRLGSLGIDAKSDLIDLSQSREFAIGNYKYVQQVLGAQSLALYSPYLVYTRERLRQKSGAVSAAPDKDLFVELVPTHPVALKAGGRLFGEQGQKQLSFQLARVMAASRPELALARVLPREKLAAVLHAVVMTGVPDHRPASGAKAAEAELKILERLDSQTRAALARLGREYAKSARPEDVGEFVEAAELTANRVGMLLCADAEVAKVALSHEGDDGRGGLKAKIRDLALFCLSPEYAQLRAALGLRIEIRLPQAAGR